MGRVSSATGEAPARQQDSDCTRHPYIGFKHGENELRRVDSLVWGANIDFVFREASTLLPRMNWWGPDLPRSASVFGQALFGHGSFLDGRV